MELKEPIETLSLNEVLGAVIEVDSYLGEVGKVTLGGRPILHYRAELQDRLETQPAATWSDLFARLRWVRHEMAVGGDPERVRCAVARIEADLTHFAQREGVADLTDPLAGPSAAATLIARHDGEDDDAGNDVADDAVGNDDPADGADDGAQGARGARGARGDGDAGNGAARCGAPAVTGFGLLLLRHSAAGGRTRATPSM